MTGFCKGYSGCGPAVGWEGFSPLGHVVPAPQRSCFEMNIADSLLAGCCSHSARPEHTQAAKTKTIALHKGVFLPPALLVHCAGDGALHRWAGLVPLAALKTLVRGICCLSLVCT